MIDAQVFRQLISPCSIASLLRDTLDEICARRSYFFSGCSNGGLETNDEARVKHITKHIRQREFYAEMTLRPSEMNAHE